MGRIAGGRLGPLPGPGHTHSLIVVPPHPPPTALSGPQKLASLTERESCCSQGMLRALLGASLAVAPAALR